MRLLKAISDHKLCAATVLILLLCFLALPHFLNSYTMMIVNIMLIWTIAAYNISIMLGMGGQLSFAVVSFQGLGAFTCANLCTDRLGLTLPPLLALLSGIAISALVSWLLALCLFRLRGTYFTFSTIAVVQVAWCFFMNNEKLFGGANGISGLRKLVLFGVTFDTYYKWFYFLVPVTLLVAFFVARIRKTQLGRALAAVRDNETAAKTLGVNVYRTKVIGFAIAGAVAGLAGGLYAMHGQFVGADMFNFANATNIIIMAMLGGVNTTPGIFIGSALVTIMPEALRAVQKYLQLCWGIVIVLLMVFMPDGVMGLFSRLATNRKRRRALLKAKKERPEEEVLR